jgi:hypothetical protein
MRERATQQRLAYRAELTVVVLAHFAPLPARQGLQGSRYSLLCERCGHLGADARPN